MGREYFLHFACQAVCLAGRQTRPRRESETPQLRVIEVDRAEPPVTDLLCGLSDHAQNFAQIARLVDRAHNTMEVRELAIPPDERLLHLLLLGHVPGDALDLDCRPAIGDQSRVELKSPDGAFLRYNIQPLRGSRRLTSKLPFYFLTRDLEGPWGKEVGKLDGEVIPGVAGEFERGLVGRQQVAVEVVRVDDVCRALDEIPVFALGESESFDDDAREPYDEEKVGMRDGRRSRHSPERQSRPYHSRSSRIECLREHDQGVGDTAHERRRDARGSAHQDSDGHDRNDENPAERAAHASGVIDNTGYQRHIHECLQVNKAAFRV